MNEKQEFDYELVMVNEAGTKEVIMQGQTIYSAQKTPENFRFPRTYVMKNVDDNQELYPTLLTRVGDNVIIEADNIRKGSFRILLENEDIVLQEILD